MVLGLSSPFKERLSTNRQLNYPIKTSQKINPFFEYGHWSGGVRYSKNYRFVKPVYTGENGKVIFGEYQAEATGCDFGATFLKRWQKNLYFAIIET